MTKTPMYFYYHLFILTLCCLNSSLTAQTVQCDSLYIASLKNKIANFEKEKATDSLLHYVPKLVQCYQEKDSLAEWIKLYANLAYDARADYSYSINLLDSIFLYPAYRQPVSSIEKAAVLKAYAMKGYLQQRNSHYLEATKSYEKTVKLYEYWQLTPNDFNIENPAYRALGNNYTRLGDNEKAQNILQKALSIGIARKNWESVAGNYANIGITYWNQGNYQKSISCYEKGLAIDSVSPYRQALLLSRMAETYHAMNSHKTALEKAEQALRLSKESKHRHIPEVEAGLYQTIASVYLNEQKYLKAISYSKQALKIGKKIHAEHSRELAKTYNLNAKILAAQQQYKKSTQQYHLALSTILPKFQPASITDLPNKDLFYNENTIFEALSGKADALHGLYQQSKDKRYLETALQCHELALEAEFNLHNVYQYESSKLYLQSQTRQRTAKAIDIAYLLYQKTQDEKYINRAFRLSESSRAVLLLEGIAQNFVASQLQFDSLFIRQNELKRNQAFCLREILTTSDSINRVYYTSQKLSIETELENLSQQVELKYPQYKHEFHNLLSGISMDAVRSSLTENTQLIEYFQTDSSLYTFKISPEKNDFIQIKMTDKSLEDIKKFISLFEKKENWDYLSPYTELGHQVYQIIYQPLNIPKGSQLIIIPDGILSSLPFDALLTASNKSETFRELPYLIHENPISYNYSASILLQSPKEKSRRKNKGLLAFAPVFKGTTNELAKSEAEVSCIIKTVGGKKFTHTKATRKAFIDAAPKHQILHLSTHADAGQDGAPPKIEFSDEAMLLPELYTLNLHADLAVLSACQTALGKHEKGEGVMSLARGFTYAGVPRLVTSLWKVNDEATANMMQYFYSHIKENTRTDQALQEAKLLYLQDASASRSAPYYWAGFVHIGRADSVALAAPSCKYWWLLLGLLVLAGIWFYWRRKRH